MVTRTAIVPEQLRGARRFTNSLAVRRKVAERLPLRLMLAYLFSTVVIFAFGPVDWPVEDWGCLLLFLFAVLGALFLGYRFGAAGAAAGTRFTSWRWVFLLGAISNIVLLFPAANLYAGKMPWQVFDVLQNQGGAYLEFQQNLALTTQGDRAAVAIIRTMVSPFILATVPLGILHWRELSRSLRVLFGATVMSIILLSLLRGTDREIADLFTVFFSAFIIVMMRKKVGRGISLLAQLNRYRFTILIVAIAFSVSAVLFMERKEQRVRSTDQICVGEEPICVNYDYPLFAPLNDRAKFTLSMLSLYLAQGYYGLSLALTKDFRTTWGLGHSLSLMNYYSAFTGNEDLYERSYTFRLRDDGWSDVSQWSTIFPWLANDIGFPAVPLVLGVLAWIWGRSWKDAIFRDNDRGAIVFIFMMLMVLYIPANNQLAQNVDAYFATASWLIIWLADRRRSHLKRYSLSGFLPAARV